MSKFGSPPKAPSSGAPKNLAGGTPKAASPKPSAATANPSPPPKRATPATAKSADKVADKPKDVVKAPPKATAKPTTEPRKIPSNPNWTVQPTAKQIGMKTKGLSDPNRVPVGAQSAKALKKAEGGQIEKIGRTPTDKAFKHVDKHGNARTYADPSYTGYRKAGKTTLGNVKGADVDHSLARKAAKAEGMKSALAKLPASSNRAHGTAEKKPRTEGRVKDGVAYANTRELHKLQGHKPPAKAKPGSEQAIINGFAGGLTAAQRGRMAKALGLDSQSGPKKPTNPKGANKKPKL